LSAHCRHRKGFYILFQAELIALVLGHAQFSWNALVLAVVAVVRWERLDRAPWALVVVGVVVSPNILHP
jgi:hypothetical protein